MIVVFVAPQVICYTLAAVGAAAQQARGRFALASAAPDGYRLVGLCGAVLLADLVAALMTLFMIRTAIRPERLLDPRRLATVGAATVAMLPASTFGFWLVQYEVHDRLPQLGVSFAMGVVALAYFGLVLALLTGQRATVIAKVRARLRA